MVSSAREATLRHSSAVKRRCSVRQPELETCPGDALLAASRSLSVTESLSAAKSLFGFGGVPSILFLRSGFSKDLPRNSKIR